MPCRPPLLETARQLADVPVEGPSHEVQRLGLWGKDVDRVNDVIDC